MPSDPAGKQVPETVRIGDGKGTVEYCFGPFALPLSARNTSAAEGRKAGSPGIKGSGRSEPLGQPIKIDLFPDGCLRLGRRIRMMPKDVGKKGVKLNPGAELAERTPQAPDRPDEEVKSEASAGGKVGKGL